MTDNSGNSRIARNTAFLYIRMALVLLITLYSSRVILNSLGVIDYGVNNVVAGFVSMFAFLNASFVATIQRFYNFELGKNGIEGVNHVYVTSLLIQVLLAVVVLILTETIGLWYLNHKLVIPEDRLGAARVLFHCSVVSMILVVLQVPFSAVIMAFERMDYYAIVGVIDVFLKLVAALVLRFVFGDRLKAYAGLLLGVAIVVFLLYFVYAKHHILRGRRRLYLDGNLFRSMMGFSAWSILGAFAQVVRNQGLNIILNLFFGPVVNAARGISFQVKGALSGFIANITTSVRPQLVTSYATGDKNRSYHLMFSISKICYLFLFLMALPVFIEMDLILHLWLGNDSVPDYTLLFSRLILIVSLVDVFNGPVSMIMYASGRIGAYNVVTSILGLLVLPLAYFLLKAGFPPYSVYYASILISVLVQSASVVIMRQTVGVSIRKYCRDVLAPCLLVTLLSAPIPFIIYFTMDRSFLRVVFVVISSIAVVSLIGFGFGLNKNEKTIIKSFVNSMISKFSR